MAAQATGNTSRQIQADRWREVPAGSSSVVPGKQSADGAAKPRPGLAFEPGSGSSPPTASPSAPKALKPKTTAGHRDEITTALDNARNAAAAYEKAAEEFRKAQTEAGDPKRKLTESDLQELERLKAAHIAAFKNAEQATAKLSKAVSISIVKACTTRGICDVGSAQKAAAKLDDAVREHGSKLQAGGTSKEEVADRQVAVRREISFAISARALDRLGPVIKGKANEEDRAKLIKEVASWAVVQEDHPAATTPVGRLSTIVGLLNVDVRFNPNNKERVTALINDLVAACERKGMNLSPMQRREILPPSP